MVSKENNALFSEEAKYPETSTGQALKPLIIRFIGVVKFVGASILISCISLSERKKSSDT